MPERAHSGIALGLLLALGAALLLAGYRAARNAVADIYAGPAISFMLYRDADTPLTDFALQSLEAAIGRGAELAPDNPDYLASLGYLQQLRLTLNEAQLTDAQLRSGSAKAQAYYARAAALRPTWPYDWGDVAIEEYRLGRYTSPLYHDALVRVARFGPWKDDEQLLITELGSDTLESLSPAAEQAYLANLDRALRRQPQLAGAIVDNYALWDEVCARAGLRPGAGEHSAGSRQFTSLAPHCRQAQLAE